MFVRGFPVVGSTPRFEILLLLCDAEMPMSQPKLRRSMSVAFAPSSRPVFWTDPRFLSTDSDDAPDDAAIGSLMIASFVLRV